LATTLTAALATALTTALATTLATALTATLATALVALRRTGGDATVLGRRFGLRGVAWTGRIGLRYAPAIVSGRRSRVMAGIAAITGIVMLRAIAAHGQSARGTGCQQYTAQR